MTQIPPFCGVVMLQNGWKIVDFFLASSCQKIMFIVLAAASTVTPVLDRNSCSEISLLRLAGLEPRLTSWRISQQKNAIWSASSDKGAFALKSSLFNSSISTFLDYFQFGLSIKRLNFVIKMQLSRENALKFQVKRIKFLDWNTALVVEYENWSNFDKSYSILRPYSNIR